MTNLTSVEKGNAVMGSSITASKEGTTNARHEAR
jgi:hypothetical protein